MNRYKIEVTDTFAGEANYCWVRRHEVFASNMRGAVRKLAQIEGRGWRQAYGDSCSARYDLKGALVCAFIDEAD